MQASRQRLSTSRGPTPGARRTITKPLWSLSETPYLAGSVLSSGQGFEQQQAWTGPGWARYWAVTRPAGVP